MSSGNVVPIGFKTRIDDRLRVALNAMPVAVSWNRLDDARVEFINRQFTTLFGYTLDDVSDVYQLMKMMFADRDQVEHAVRDTHEILASGLTEELSFPAKEVEIICKNGSRLTTLFSGVMLPEANMSLATFVDITEAKQLQANLASLANQDQLTGLVNRRSFDAELARVIGQSPADQPFGLVVMDLDGMKEVNDTYGHQAGDVVLKHFADLMRKTFRTTDCVSRWGGDEFAAIVRHPASRADVDAAAVRLEQALARPALVGATSVPVQVSIGSAYFPEDANEITALYDVADARMYEAKRRHKDAS